MKLPKIRKIPPLDVQALDVDMILSKLKGKAYDVRDFLSEGSFHHQKVAMYLEINEMDRQKSGKAINKNEKCAKCHSFLSEEVANAAGLLIKNGSLYDDGNDDESDDMDLDEDFDSS